MALTPEQQVQFNAWYNNQPMLKMGGDEMRRKAQEAWLKKQPQGQPQGQPAGQQNPFGALQQQATQAGLPPGEGFGQTEFNRNMAGAQGFNTFMNQMPVQNALGSIFGNTLGAQGFNPFQMPQQQFYNPFGGQQGGGMGGQQNPNAFAGESAIGANGAGAVNFAAQQQPQQQSQQAQSPFNLSPLTDASMQSAMGALQNVPDINALMQQLKAQTTSDINESSAARGAFGGSANQNQLGQAMGMLNLQGLGLQQQMQNQALNNALGTQGQLFGQGLQQAGFNQGVGQQQFQNQQMPLQYGMNFLGQQNPQQGFQNAQAQQQQNPWLSLLGQGAQVAGAYYGAR